MIPVTETDVAAYERDGVVCLRGAFDAVWVGILCEAVERDLLKPGPHATNFAEGSSSGKFFGDMFMWRRDPDFRAAFFETGCAALAGEAMAAAEVRLFYDQIFAKEPGTARRTPWHQDYPYWPVSGDMFCTVYVALDAIDAENGAVEYVAGSHRGLSDYRPAPFRAGGEDAARYAASALDAVPDIDALRGTLDIRRFDLAPGDAVVFHGRLVHGAGGNASAGRRRRTLALRFAGEDARWREGVSTFRPLRKAGLRTGEPLSARPDLFPLLWTRS